MLIRTLLPELFVGKFKDWVLGTLPFVYGSACVFVRIDVKNYNSQITKAENFVDKVDKLISW